MRIVIGIILGTVVPLLLERLMSAAPEWCWRSLALGSVVLGTAFVMSSNAVLPYLRDYGQHRVASTTIVSLAGAVVVGSLWLFFVVKFSPLSLTDSQPDRTTQSNLAT